VSRVTQITGNPAPSRKSRKSRAWLPPLVLISLFMLWELGVQAFGVPAYLLPAPSKVFQTMWAERSSLLDHATITLLESLAGFTVGNLIAILLAIAFVENSTIEQIVYPIAVALRTVPIIAIVPILTLLLGNEWQPKVAIAALITFFPTLVDMIKGLTSPQRELLELAHVLDANRWYVLRRIRIPASVPYLFASLRVAATSAVLGAIVAEWIGSQRGIGYVIVLSTYQFRGDLLYAGIFLAAAMAMSLFGLVAWTERVVVHWENRTEIGGH